MNNRTKETIYCIGCGAELQANEENQSGYLPQSALDKAVEEPDKEIYCKRCFRLRHYNEVSDVELTSDDFLNLLNEISDSPALIVHLVDIFDFEGSLITGINRFAGKNPILLVGNKVDLLPKSLKSNRMRQWMSERAHEVGIRPEEVFLMSALSHQDTDQLMALIEKHRQGKDVFVVGTTNVGKSTLINRIIHQASGESNLITTSYFPGTTLGKIEIPLDDGSVIVDTPGIIQRGQVLHQLSREELKIVVPKKEIKPKVYQLNPGQSLYYGGLARMDFIKGERNSFINYFSNQLKIHRTKTTNADDLYQKQVGNLLQPPFDKAHHLPSMVHQSYEFAEDREIVISGLGWVHIPKHCKTTIWVPKGVDVFTRKPLV